MEPIPETRELLDLLWPGTGSQPLEDWLLIRAQQVAASVPDCVGLTIALIGDLGLTFTFVATADDLRLIDAAQYLAGGPCEDAAYSGQRIEAELLSEREWHLMALASAWTGVRSSLSLPIRAGGTAMGSVNVYGASTSCFTGRAEELAVLFGAVAQEAVLNGDLSMTGVQRARRSTTQMVDATAVYTATSVLARRASVSADEARRRLDHAASRAGVTVTSLAKLLVAEAELASG